MGESLPPRKYGGLGIKDFQAWNKAKIAKPVWAVATKKDILWLKWVHEKYLKGIDLREYTPPKDCLWYWRKLYSIKEIFKQGITSTTSWEWQGKAHYTVKEGYLWLLGQHTKASWARMAWTRTIIPRHAFILWVLLHHRTPTKVILAKFIGGRDMTCSLYQAAPEDEVHLLEIVNTHRKSGSR